MSSKLIIRLSNTSSLKLQILHQNSQKTLKSINFLSIFFKAIMFFFWIKNAVYMVKLNVLNLREIIVTSLIIITNWNFSCTKTVQTINDPKNRILQNHLSTSSSSSPIEPIETSVAPRQHRPSTTPKVDYFKIFLALVNIITYWNFRCIKTASSDHQRTQRNTSLQKYPKQKIREGMKLNSKNFSTNKR